MRRVLRVIVGLVAVVAAAPVTAAAPAQAAVATDTVVRSSIPCGDTYDGWRGGPWRTHPFPPPEPYPGDDCVGCRSGPVTYLDGRPYPAMYAHRAYIVDGCCTPRSTPPPGPVPHFWWTPILSWWPRACV
jgi:hypothetical protein